MENFTDLKLEIFVPYDHALKLRDEVAKIGVGQLENYHRAVAISQELGCFLPLIGAKPFDGEIGKVRETVEYTVEINGQRALFNEALKVIRSVHLCEEPLVNIIPLANHFFDLNGMLGK